MAVYFDQNGNLVDTEISESSNVFMQDPTENFYQPRMDISPTQDFYQPQMDISPTQDFYQPQMDISPTQDFYQPRQFINAPQNYYQTDLTSTKGLPTLDLQSLPANMGVANEDDERQVDSLTGQKKSTGIMDLIMSVAIPGYGFFKNIARGGMDGIRSLNQRIRNTDFAKSSSLADYFDAKSYGGRDERDRAASQNMREARAIQRQVDMRGDSTSKIADRNRGSVTTASAAKSRGVGGGGYTRSDSTRDSFRGRY